jgi:type VI secretion system ImpM family protein
MWRSTRRKKDEFETPFADDVIFATGKLPLHPEFIRYRIASDSAAAFDSWIQEIFAEWKKFANIMPFHSLPYVYSVTSSLTESSLPTLMMIAPSYDISQRDYPFAIKRILEHPLAREFKTVIPWLYRDCISSFQQFISQSFDKMTLLDIYPQIENLKIFNSRLMRKTALEPIVYKLRYLLLPDFWKMLNLKFNASEFLINTTYLLKQFRNNLYKGILLPLPNDNEWLFAGIVFWMQLIESISKDKTEHWQIYWHEKTAHHKASLLFYKGSLSSQEFSLFWQGKKLSESIANAFELSSLNTAFPINSLTSDKPLPLITLLSRWCEKIIN